DALRCRGARSRHRGMLDGGRDHFAWTASEDGERVRLGPARGEDHVPRRAAQRPRASLTGEVDEGARVLTGFVYGGRIREELRQGRHHLRHHFARQRGGGVCVQVDGCRSHGSSGTNGVPGPGRRWNARRNVAKMSFASSSGERPRSGIRAPAIAPWPPALPPSGAQTSRTSLPALTRRSFSRSERYSSPLYDPVASDQRSPSRLTSFSATSGTISGT